MAGSYLSGLIAGGVKTNKTILSVWLMPVGQVLLTFLM